MSDTPNRFTLGSNSHMFQELCQCAACKARRDLQPDYDSKPTVAERDSMPCSNPDALETLRATRWHHDDREERAWTAFYIASMKAGDNLDIAARHADYALALWRKRWAR